MIDKNGDHAARLEIAGTLYQDFPVVHVLKLKLDRMFPDRPMERLRVKKTDRVDFNEALLPEVGNMEEDELKVKRITDIRSGQRTHYGRVHKYSKSIENYMTIRHGWTNQLTSGS